MNRINETRFLGAQKRIDFLGRWGLAFFAVVVVLAGWLGVRYESGEFGIMFGIGAGCIVIATVFCLGFTWAAHQRIKRLEAPKDD